MTGEHDSFDERLKRAQVRKQSRLAICTECEHLIKEFNGMPIDWVCGLCGCALKAKAGFKKSECPIGKWKTE